jgi:hypothetical protein
MPVMAVARFERFFRTAASLDVDKDDLKRYSDFVNQKLYDMLIIGQATARANGRDVIEPWDLPITKGLQESIHDFGDIDKEIELQPILDHLTTAPNGSVGHRGDRGEASGHRGRPEHRAGPHVHHRRPEAPEPAVRTLAARVPHLRPAALSGIRERGKVA